MTKFFNLTNLFKFIIIFFVGFVYRALVNGIFGINVYFYFLHTVSYIYYMFFSSFFIIFVHNFFSYCEFNIFSFIKLLYETIKNYFITVNLCEDHDNKGKRKALPSFKDINKEDSSSEDINDKGSSYSLPKRKNTFFTSVNSVESSNSSISLPSLKALNLPGQNKNNKISIIDYPAHGCRWNKSMSDNFINTSLTDYSTHGCRRSKPMSDNFISRDNSGELPESSQHQFVYKYELEFAKNGRKKDN